MQDSVLRLSARVWDVGADANTVPGLRLTVGPDAQKVVNLLHQQADWVLTIDRNFGVEYYDSPTDANLAVPSAITCWITRRNFWRDWGIGLWSQRAGRKKSVMCLPAPCRSLAL